MKISMDRNNPAYNPMCRGSAVFLDGVEQCDVVTADEDRGFIIQLVRDENGRLQLNERRTEALKAHVSGAVRVDLPARFWA